MQLGYLVFEQDIFLSNFRDTFQEKNFQALFINLFFERLFDPVFYTALFRVVIFPIIAKDRQRRIKREGESDTRANTQLDLALEQFRRAQEWRNEDKAEARQKRIQEAFQALGKAVSGSRGGISMPSGGGGGGQNPGAFNYNLRKTERRPPTVGKGGK